MLGTQAIAQHPTQELPAGVPRDNVDELNATREALEVHLVVGDMLHHSVSSQRDANRVNPTYLNDCGLDLLRLSGILLDPLERIGAWHDERKGHLAAILVGLANDADIGDVLQLEDVSLELWRRN